MQVFTGVDLELPGSLRRKADLVIVVERELQVILTRAHAFLPPTAPSLLSLLAEHSLELGLFEAVGGTDQDL